MGFGYDAEANEVVDVGLCTAQLGLKALALAWLEAALALSKLRPGQSCHCWLGSSLAWPRPWLLAYKYLYFYFTT